MGANPTRLLTMVSIDKKPYDGVDWDNLADPNGTGNPPKTEFHNHARGSGPTATKHGVIDLYAGEGPDDDGNYIDEPYTIFAQAPSSGPAAWPWTELSNIFDGEYENRDPEELGVVAFPAYELHFGTHINVLFSTVRDVDVRRGGIPEKAGDPIGLDAERGVPAAITGFAHPEQYIDNISEMTDREYERYRFNVERMGFDDGLGVMEIFNRRDTIPSQSMILWDRLLSDFAPGDWIWGCGVDDPRLDYVVGGEVDRGWTSVLVHEDEFDPSEQVESRQHAYDAFINGRLLSHQRIGWDAENEDAPEPPMPLSIETDGTTITWDFDAGSGAETVVKVIADRDVVETGGASGEYEITNSDVPYARLQAETGDDLDGGDVIGGDVDALTTTQPWLLGQS